MPCWLPLIATSGATDSGHGRQNKDGRQRRFRMQRRGSVGDCHFDFVADRLSARPDDGAALSEVGPNTITQKRSYPYGTRKQEARLGQGGLFSLTYSDYWVFLVAGAGFEAALPARRAFARCLAFGLKKRHWRFFLTPSAFKLCARPLVAALTLEGTGSTSDPDSPKRKKSHPCGWFCRVWLRGLATNFVHSSPP